MKCKTLFWSVHLTVALTVMALAVLTTSGLVYAGRNANPRVLPPSSTPYGVTYGEWSARWWQWALGQPVSSNPLQDTTGAFCGVGQSGPVWFLAGTFGGGLVTRNCTIPTGKAVFFPVANAFCTPDPGTTGTPDQERACAKAFMDAATDLSAEVDGVSLQNLQRYRVQSPIFDLTLPDNNIFGVPAGVYTPTAADGVQLIVAPLHPGRHVIHFHAFFTDSGSTLDVTYHLNVVPTSK